MVTLVLRSLYHTVHTTLLPGWSRRWCASSCSALKTDRMQHAGGPRSPRSRTRTLETEPRPQGNRHLAGQYASYLMIGWARTFDIIQDFIWNCAMTLYEKMLMHFLSFVTRITSSGKSAPHIWRLWKSLQVWETVPCVWLQNSASLHWTDHRDAVRFCSLQWG